jgi:hypothetical protein
MFVGRSCAWNSVFSVRFFKLSVRAGLPLTVLDHNLVQGNALIGIAIHQIRDRFQQSATSLFPVDAENLLGQAQQPLARLAKLADASLNDVDSARLAMAEARLAMRPTSAPVARLRRRCR